ncbi:MAG: NAD(P)-binding domain-containing protein [Microcella sp.]|uniref:ketopantoate reductase family protein n=1 Tax=Microcella sp. TaxID=1913979 RepID=UPI0024C6B7CE|nr:2-dehydropantoate 2-reductase N-terminal domain-containing protein [Microcella sp.]UYN82670.1 MAG: NAD(P)-binding domain-containing protein [Microcella sp.]
MTRPRIAVLGTGAQGAGIAADIIRAGHDVTLIEQWPANVDAMRERGIEVRMPRETVITPAQPIHFCDVATLREPFDIVLVLVKAYDTRWAVELISPLLADDGVVVGVQNGMTMDDIAAVVGPHRTLGAVIEMASNLFDPGIVNRQNAPADSWFAVGGVDARAHSRAEVVRDIMSCTGTVEISDDIRSSKWMKLVANAGELVPSAILDLPLADAVRLPGVHEFMIRAGAEAARAALADGSRLVSIFGLSDDELTDPESYAARLLGEVLDKYSLPDTRTTVLQDWMKGRRSEFRELNGLVADVLARSGEGAPVNAHVVDLAERIERGELQRGIHLLDTLLAGGA